MQQVPFISNRFAMSRFLGMSKEEIAENERLWKEENDEMFDVGAPDASASMRDAGITGADISGDLESAQGDEIAGDDDIAGGAGTLAGEAGGAGETPAPIA